jgi:hypothetical protein
MMTVHKICAATLLSGVVGFVAPSFAATTPSNAQSTIGLDHTSTKAAGLTGAKKTQVDRHERQITAELNRRALQGEMSAGSTNATEPVASTDAANPTTEAEIPAPMDTTPTSTGQEDRAANPAPDNSTPTSSEDTGGAATEQTDKEQAPAAK